MYGFYKKNPLIDPYSQHMAAITNYVGETCISNYKRILDACKNCNSSGLCIGCQSLLYRACIKRKDRRSCRPLFCKKCVREVDNYDKIFYKKSV